jgi:hypothetical protein
MSGIGLADAIQEIRQELTRVIAEGEGQSSRFMPGPVLACGVRECGRKRLPLERFLRFNHS